jgi:2-amino-4-hydroxy-6-hydroxymethyldihydropteridine diphosphokinase
VILIAIGSNLAAPGYLSPHQTAEAALTAFREVGIQVETRSPWYLSEPVPASDQPWFVNGVAAVATGLTPHGLLARLLAVEARFGRERGPPNAARTLDLDLLDHDRKLCETEALILPHPRLHRRRFVLAPLCDIAPDWRHPRLGLTASELLAALPAGEGVRRLEG